MTKTKRISTSFTLSETILTALNLKADKLGEFRSHIVEAALIKSGFLDLPKGMKAGMDKRKTGRPSKVKA